MLSDFAKIFDYLLYNDILHQVKPFLEGEQHGFVKTRFTVTNLLEITQFISKSIDTGKQINVIYTNFSKAFDTLDLTLVLYKLDARGFCNTSLSFVSSYLSECVCYGFNNSFSFTFFVGSSGVVQGSNLGHLLFNIYVNNHEDGLEIFTRVSKKDDTSQVQKDVNTITNGSHLNNILINPRFVYYFFPVSYFFL